MRDSSAAQIVAARLVGGDLANARASARRATRQLEKFAQEAKGLVNLAARKRCAISEVTPDDAIRLGPFVFDKEPV